MQISKINFKNVFFSIISWCFVVLFGLFVLMSITQEKSVGSSFFFMVAFIFSIPKVRSIIKEKIPFKNKFTKHFMFPLIIITLFIIGANFLPKPIDSDGDGLTDNQEKLLKTDLFLVDTDHDGLSDKDDADPLNASMNFSKQEYALKIEEQKSLNKEVSSIDTELGKQINSIDKLLRSASINLEKKRGWEQQLLDLKTQLQKQLTINEKKEILTSIASLKNDISSTPPVKEEQKDNKEESFLSNLFSGSKNVNEDLRTVYNILSNSNEIKRKELWKAYYNGNRVAWTVYVSNIDETILGKPRVLAKSSPVEEYEFDTEATIIFKKNQREKFYDIQEGYKITIEGELFAYEDFIGDVHLFVEDATLVGYEKGYVQKSPLSMLIQQYS